MEDGSTSDKHAQSDVLHLLSSQIPICIDIRPTQARSPPSHPIDGIGNFDFALSVLNSTNNGDNVAEEVQHGFSTLRNSLRVAAAQSHS